MRVHENNIYIPVHRFVSSEVLARGLKTLLPPSSRSNSRDKVCVHAPSQ
jgi:hypothetical protein